MFYLQGSAERSVLTVDQEQGGDSCIMEANGRVCERLCLASWSADKEDSHLPHEEAAAHSLESVVGQKVHGDFQIARLLGLKGLQALDVLEQGLLPHCVGKADFCGHLVVVQGQSNASSSWAVALSDGDVSEQAHDHVTHIAE